MISYVDLRRYVMVFHTQTISQVHGCQQMNACSGGARPGGCNQVVLESKGRSSLASSVVASMVKVGAM